MWEARVGGIPVCLIGFESHTRPRTGFVPADGPPSWTSGTADTIRVVRAEMLKQVADEFDNVHDIRRALQVGSVDHIIPPGELRPFIIGALERRLATGADLAPPP